MNLHFYEWGKGGCGIGNSLMSLQIAVILSFLTNRQLYFYRVRSLAHSEKEMYLEDLFACENINFLRGEIPKQFTTFDSSGVFCYDELPDDNFLLGRSYIDLSTLKESDIAASHEVLNYYSYKIYFSKKRKEALKYMMKVLAPKQKYLDIAEKMIEILKCDNSYHIRRNDFLNGSNQYVQSALTIKKTIHEYFDNSRVLIHTDEKNNSFFDDFGNNIILVDKFIKKIFHDLCSIEVAFVSMLIASKSNKFIGNFGSTFSGIINQARMLNGKTENFIYINQPYTTEKPNREKKIYMWNLLHNNPYELCFEREYEDCGF